MIYSYLNAKVLFIADVAIHDDGRYIYKWTINKSKTQQDIVYGYKIYYTFIELGIKNIQLEVIDKITNLSSIYNSAGSFAPPPTTVLFSGLIDGGMSGWSTYAPYILSSTYYDGPDKNNIYYVEAFSVSNIVIKKINFANRALDTIISTTPLDISSVASGIITTSIKVDVAGGVYNVIITYIPLTVGLISGAVGENTVQVYDPSINSWNEILSNATIEAKLSTSWSGVTTSLHPSVLFDINLSRTYWLLFEKEYGFNNTDTDAYIYSIKNGITLIKTDIKPILEGLLPAYTTYSVIVTKQQTKYSFINGSIPGIVYLLNVTINGGTTNYSYSLELDNLYETVNQIFRVVSLGQNIVYAIPYQLQVVAGGYYMKYYTIISTPPDSWTLNSYDAYTTILTQLVSTNGTIQINPMILLDSTGTPIVGYPLQKYDSSSHGFIDLFTIDANNYYTYNSEFIFRSSASTGDNKFSTVDNLPMISDIMGNYLLPDDTSVFLYRIMV